MQVGGEQWTVYRRYAEFRSFHKVVCQCGMSQSGMSQGGMSQSGGGRSPQKKPKKPSQFTNFGVATGFFWFFLGFLVIFGMAF